MKKFTSLKVVLALIIAVGALGFAYYKSLHGLNDLSLAINKASQPDQFSIRLQKLNNRFIAAESSIRAFSVSQEDKYLYDYNILKKSFSLQIDSLQILSPDNQLIKNTIAELRKLALSKFEIYDELMMISYTRIFDSTFIRISDQLPEGDSLLVDTLPVMEKKKNFFHKIFGSSGPTKKEMQATIDSVLNVRQAQQTKTFVANRKIEEIKLKQLQLMQQQSARELWLLKEDERISSRIISLIHSVEAMNAAFEKQNAASANREAANTIRFIKWLMIGGSLLIMLFVALILFDILKSNRYRKELTVAKTHAEQIAKSKEEFLATMSHELRTPLSTILGYTARLSKTELSDKQQLYAKSIQSSGEHLLSIVNDILDLTKAGKGKFVFENISFSPFDTVKEVSDALKIKADEKNLSLVISVSRISNLIVTGDALRLKQVLYNLIGNAIKFTDNGSVTINAAAKKNENNSKFDFEFSITDTGTGIPQAKLKALFSDYSQADASINRRFGGSGLGLSISKKIIEQQGGGIEVKSKPHEGSTFTFFIPYEIVEERKVRIEEALVKPEKKITEKHLAGIKILLAEDVEVNRLFQTETLKDFGAEVIAVENGNEILAELIRSVPAIVIMDIQMPEMGGMEAISKIRNELKMQVPVLATTANAMQHDEEKYAQAGFDGSILKPFRDEELVTKILALVKKDSTSAIVKEDETAFPSDTRYDLTDLIKSSKGNDDFVARMLKLFLKSSDSILEKANKAAADKNWKEVATQAHKLIPSCRQLSVDAMTLRLKKIEDTVMLRPNERHIVYLLSETMEAFEKIRFALQNEISNYENLKRHKT